MITKKGLFLEDIGEKQMTARFFESEKEYKEWKEYTEKNGHDMISFYKVKQMVSQYHPFTKEEIKELLETN